MGNNVAYARYMLAWLDLLDLPTVPEIENTLAELRAHWLQNQPVDWEKSKVRVWSWVDANGGARITNDRAMLKARMVICLAEENNRELEDIGFFDGLLSHLGISRKEIEKYGPGNLPGGI